MEDKMASKGTTNHIRSYHLRPHHHHHHHHHHLHTAASNDHTLGSLSAGSSSVNRHSQEYKCRRHVTSNSTTHPSTPSSHNHHIARPSSREILEKIGFSFLDGYKIGKGRYSKVMQGLYQSAQKKFAIKVIDLESVTADFREKFLPRELQCWKGLSHPNICYLYRDFAKCNYQFAIMELAQHGDLLNHVQTKGPVPEPTARKWMCQLINAIGYLHSHNIAHRDLKMENVLLFESGGVVIVKISDFGFCKQSVDLSSTYCGSKSYSAPEILSGSTYNTFKADVWSLGVVGFVMLTNTMPFREDVESNTIIIEAQRERRYRYPRDLGLSTACRSSVDTMMTFNAYQRPTIRDCCHLTWFRSTGIAAGHT